MGMLGTPVSVMVIILWTGLVIRSGAQTNGTNNVKLFGSSADMTWLEGRSICLFHGRDLVKLTSQTENDQLVQEVAEKCQGPSTSIGLTLGKSFEIVPGLTIKGHLWGDGVPLSWSNWAANQPDGNLTVDYCTVMDNAQGKWSNVKCEEKACYVCGELEHQEYGYRRVNGLKFQGTVLGSRDVSDQDCIANCVNTAHCALTVYTRTTKKCELLSDIKSETPDPDTITTFMAPDFTDIDGVKCDNEDVLSATQNSRGIHHCRMLCLSHGEECQAAEFSQRVNTCSLKSNCDSVTMNDQYTISKIVAATTTAAMTATTMTGSVTGEMTTTPDIEGSNTVTIAAVVIGAIFIAVVVVVVIWIHQNTGTQEMGVELGTGSGSAGLLEENISVRPSGARRDSAGLLEENISVKPSGARRDSGASLGSDTSDSQSSSPY